MPDPLHVLCNNDYPHSVFEDLDVAEKECARLNKEDEKRDKWRRIFYHVNTVPFIEKLDCLACEGKGRRHYEVRCDACKGTGTRATPPDEPLREKDEER